MTLTNHAYPAKTSLVAPLTWGTGLICTEADASQKTRSFGYSATQGAQGLSEGGVERTRMEKQLFGR